VRKVNLAQKLASFSEYFSPRIVGELNGQHVKVVKFRGEFVWHRHHVEDELFLVLRGGFRMGCRDETGAEREMPLTQGEFVIVPRGMEHRPAADEEVEILLFEPATTVNTGNLRGALTVDQPERI
jgi:mannose-6-phosphate isomerase-like protein (cupin superfamily)